jgi:hypothetical protein
LPLAPFRSRDPSALDVGLARKPSTLATSPASEMRAVFLRLVTTVLAIHACSLTHQRESAGGSRRLIGDAVGVSSTRTQSKRVVVAQVLLLLIVLRPYLKPFGVDLLVSEQKQAALLFLFFLVFVLLPFSSA